MPSPEIKTLPLPYPLIAFSPLPEDPTHILLSLDTAWGKVTGNIKAFGEHGPGAGATGKGKGKGKEEITFTQEELETYNSSLRVVGISADGEVSYYPVIFLPSDGVNRWTTDMIVFLVDGCIG